MSENPKKKVVITETGVEVSKIKELFEYHQNAKPGKMDREQLLEQIKDADGILCLLRDKIDKEFLDHASKLKVISTISVGFEHIDVDECRKRGILVGNTPDVLTETTAELGALLILATSRNMKSAMSSAMAGGAPVWSPYLYCAMGVQGTTIGVFGLGRIGEAVAKRMEPFKPKEIIYHNRNKKQDSPYRYVSFDELVATSDILVICVDAASCPARTFNKDVFRKMKKTAMLINISRGVLVDHSALFEALKEGEIAAAGLDVTYPEPLPATHPLFQLDQCTIFPHIGSATFDTRNAMVNLAEQNLINGLQNTAPFIGPVGGSKWS